MPLVFHPVDHLFELWGGPPGPQADASSACSQLNQTDFYSRRGPGGRPTNTYAIPRSLKKRAALVRSPFPMDTGGLLLIRRAAAPAGCRLSAV
jgi:hypothetical protein